MSAHRLAPLRRRGTIAQRWARIRKRLRLLSFQIARVPINDRRTYGTLAVRARYLTALARSTAQRRRWRRIDHGFRKGDVLVSDTGVMPPGITAHTKYRIV